MSTTTFTRIGTAVLMMMVCPRLGMTRQMSFDHWRGWGVNSVVQADTISRFLHPRSAHFWATTHRRPLHLPAVIIALSIHSSSHHNIGRPSVLPHYTKCRDSVPPMHTNERKCSLIEFTVAIFRAPTPHRHHTHTRHHQHGPHQEEEEVECVITRRHPAMMMVHVHIYPFCCIRWHVYYLSRAQHSL